MARASVNSIELEYETFGRPGDPLVLLIMGLASQLVLWPTAFCHALAEAGHFVVRYDNRDVGKSTRLVDAGVPDFDALARGLVAGEAPQLAYGLEDMAADAAALIDRLGYRSAHVVGASMGGMIGQLLTLDHPERVASFVGLMTTSGDPALPQASPEVLAVLFAPPRSAARADLIEAKLAARRLIESPSYREEESVLRARIAEEVDRVPYDPAGGARQYAAILAAKPRAARLAAIRCPVLVIHGDSDILVPPEGGRDLAARIPQARLLSVSGMGHDITTRLTPVLLAPILDFLAEAGAAAQETM
jgi:pimeloyl-ACP methyl ester carboxylesterase